MAGGPAGPVIAGIAVGTGFIIMFALFAPLMPSKVEQVPPAPISPDDDATPAFGEATNLSNSEGDSGLSDIVMGGNAVYVLWSEGAPVVRPRIDETYDVFFMQSIEGDRAVFGSPYNLSNTSSLSGDPTLTVFENQFSVIWYEVTGDAGNTEILYRRGQDVSGPPGEFEETKNLSNTPNESEHLDVLASGNDIYVAWREFPWSNSEAGTEILFRASKNSGRTFENPVSIIKGLDDFACPKIAVSGDNVYVSWLAYSSQPGKPDRQVMFAASSDGGMSFGEPVELSADEADCPEIAASGQNVYVAWSGIEAHQGAFWQEPTYTQHVYVRISHDAGKDFDQAIQLGSDTIASVEPQIATAGDYLLVVWVGGFQNAKGPTGEIFLARSEDGGSTFSTVNLSNSEAASYAPQLEVLSNYVHVAWLEGDFSSEQSQIMFRRSVDWGASFGNTVTLTEPIYIYGRPVVSTDYNGRVYVGWSAYQEPEEPFSDVFFVTTPYPYGYLGIGKYGLDVIQSRVVKGLVSEAFEDQNVASLLDSDVHNVLIENNFEGYDELPDVLTVIVIGDRTVQGDWQTSYRIMDSNRKAIVITLNKVDDRPNIGSIEIQPLKDRVDTLTFDKTRQKIIAAAMQDRRFTSLLEGKDAYIYLIRDWGVATSGGECPVDGCAVVGARQVDKEEFMSALVNTETGKVVSVSKSAGW